MVVHKDPSPAQVVNELSQRFLEADRLAAKNDAWLDEPHTSDREQLTKATIEHHATAKSLAGMLIYMTNDERWNQESNRHEQALRRVLRPGLRPVLAQASLK